MKYIYAGYSKSGTKTLATMFRALNYEVYDLEETLIFHYAEWTKILDPYNKLSADEKKAILKKMYQDVDIVMDIPSYFYWKELLEIFPEAKVIFSERPEDKWWPSFHHQHVHSGQQFYFLPDVIAKPFRRIYTPTMTKINTMLELACTRYTSHKGFGITITGGRMDLDELSCRQIYRMHNANVKNNCPKDRLLILPETKDWTWKAICDFTGDKIPDMPVPHENVGGEIIDKILAGQNRKGEVKLMTVISGELKTRLTLTAVVGLVGAGVLLYRVKKFPGLFVM